MQQTEVQPQLHFFDRYLRVSCNKFLISHLSFKYLTGDLTRILVDLGLVLVFFLGTLGIPRRYSTVILEKRCNKLYVFNNFLLFSSGILVALSKVIFSSLALVF